MASPMDYWARVQQVPRFTLLAEFPRPSTLAPFRLANLQVHYLGDGWFAACRERRFRLDGERRVEYGQRGEYVVSILHFAVAADAAEKFLVPVEPTSFPGLGKQGPFEVLPGVWLGQDFGLVSETLQARQGEYADGESRRLRDGLPVFSHQWIDAGPFSLWFFAKGKSARLMACSYTLAEGGEPLGLQP